MRWSFVFMSLATGVFCGKTPKMASKVVQLPQGPVRGYKDPEMNIFVFYGIPYAKAPTGPNRFQAPLPAPVWTKTLDAVNKYVACPQPNQFLEMYRLKYNMQEDCLIANVYVPNTSTTNQKLPVVVYVHGGAFHVGLGDLSTPKNLVQSKNVIVVTFNYRLGVHGFLCLGTKYVPGNAGMKDQIALLQWVKKNVANFGGNSKDITLVGYSAGATSVDLLLLSPLAKGLFNKVIVESGSNTVVWSVQQDPLKNAKDYAKLLNFTNIDDFYALEEFYKTVPNEVLNFKHFLVEPDSTFVFSVCVERNTGENNFLNDTPINILKKGKYIKVPMLYGFASMEGIFRLPVFEYWKDSMNVKFSNFLPADLQFDNENQREAVAKEVKKFYFKKKTVSSETIKNYIDYFSDVQFSYGVLRSIQLHVEAGNDNVYLYEYSFVEDIDIPVQYPSLRGARHCAHSMAVLDGPEIGNTGEKNISDEFRKVKATMRELVYNFVKTGNPAPEGSSFPAWPPANTNVSPFMEVGRELELKAMIPLEKRKRFWDAIYEKYYRSPIPPSAPPAKHK